ncbi:MAG: hypothetical protein E6Q97_25330 [Desulfurellales bacterium]|nr:MAG: hypothetical protein E6Q97_25330 [Desulfurellales bacterium]
MKTLVQRLDWADVLAGIGLILLGVALHQIGGMTALIFYVATLFLTLSLVISYQQGKNAGG